MLSIVALSFPLYANIAFTQLIPLSRSINQPRLNLGYLNWVHSSYYLCFILIAELTSGESMLCKKIAIRSTRFRCICSPILLTLMSSKCSIAKSNFSFGIALFKVLRFSFKKFWLFPKLSANMRNFSFLKTRIRKISKKFIYQNMGITIIRRTAYNLTLKKFFQHSVKMYFVLT